MSRRFQQYKFEEIAPGAVCVLGSLSPGQIVLEHIFSGHIVLTMSPHPFNGRRHLIEYGLWWETRFGGSQPKMDVNILY